MARLITKSDVYFMAKAAGCTPETLKEVLRNPLAAGKNELVGDIKEKLQARLDLLRKGKANIDQRLRTVEQELKDAVTVATHGLITLPDRYYPHTPETFLARFLTMPNIAIDLAKHASPLATHEDIGPGIEIIERLAAEGLILFAEHVTGIPALFTAAAKDFLNPADLDIAHNLVGYFDCTGNFDAKRGEIPHDDSRYAGDLLVSGGGEDATVDQWFAQSSTDLRKVQNDLHVSRHVLYGIMLSMEQRGMLKLRKLEDGFSVHVLVKDIAEMAPREREAVISIKRHFGAFIEKGRIKLGENDYQTWGPLKTEGSNQHAYMRAIQTQYTALAVYSKLLHIAHSTGNTNIDGISVDATFSHDVHALKQAETYCWFDEPLHAVEAAAVTLPDSVHLTRELTGGNAGWWYFSEPLDLQTTGQENDGVMALLWGWSMYGDQPGVYFSSFVYADLGRAFGYQRGPMATTKWFWPEGTTLAQAMLDSGVEYDKMYGDQSKFPERWKRGPMSPVGKDRTLATVERQIKIFAAGCLWIQQRILVQERGHVERHERKRIEREHKMERPLGDVQIIQLRRRQAVKPATSGDGKHVDWKCRWVVSGFWRDQWYPSKGKHAPKWINAFVKGPGHLPLKLPTHKVYVVKK